MIGSGDGSTGCVGAGSSVVSSSCGSNPLAVPATNVTIVTNIKTRPIIPNRRQVLIFILQQDDRDGDHQADTSRPKDCRKRDKVGGVLSALHRRGNTKRKQGDGKDARKDL